MSVLDLAAAVVEQAVYDAQSGPLIQLKPGQNDLFDAIAAWVGVEPFYLCQLINRNAKNRELAGVTRKTHDTHARVFSEQTRLRISQARARYEARKHMLTEAPASPLDGILDHLTTFRERN